VFRPLIYITTAPLFQFYLVKVTVWSLVLLPIDCNMFTAMLAVLRDTVVAYMVVVNLSA